MTIADKIRDEKLRYQQRSSKISALSSGKSEKYECLTGEEILLPDQSLVIEEANFIYYPLVKAFEKEIQTIEGQGKNKLKF